MPSLESIGNTALMKIDDIFVKLECSNPGGSVKDRIAYFMLQEAERRGDLKKAPSPWSATRWGTG
jgi:cysteine synthase